MAQGALLPPSSYAPHMTIPIPMDLYTKPGRYTPSKLMWWHDSIIDLMIQHPGWTKKQIGKELNASPMFISMITTSDLFQARYTKRREEHFRNLSLDVVSKVSAVADRTLDRILAQLNDEAKPIPINHLESLADKTLSRLGYGPKLQPPSPTVNIQADRAQVVVIPAARSDLEEARRLIRQKEAELALGTVVEMKVVSPPTFGHETMPSAPSEDIPSLEDL